MHDHRGRPLAKGDTVLIPATITELMSTEDFCNVSLESLYGRRPDDAKERVYAINTGVLLRANPDDAESDALTPDEELEDEEGYELCSFARPRHEVFVPIVERNGDGWQARYCSDLAVETITGWGKTPNEAIAAYDAAWDKE